MLSREESFLPLPASGGPRHPWLMAASLQSLPPQTAKIMASSPTTSWQADEKKWKQQQILFSWAAMKLRHLLLGRKAMT